MNVQSGEAPLLFKFEPFQLWTHVYESYYHQKGGWMAGLVLFAFNAQAGLGRNAFTLTALNFGVTCSWNARRVSKVIEPQLPQSGPRVEMKCACGATATAMTPICEPCAMERLKLLGAPQP